MAESLSPHQLIASEEYWDNPHNQPEIPFLPSAIDEFTLDVFSHFGAIKLRNLYRDALSHGHLVEPIAAGTQLPTLERGTGLIRIVEDRKIDPVPKSTVYRLWTQGVDQDSDETFDRVANQMIGDHTYNGESARRTLRLDEAESETRIIRAVYYLTGSKSGLQLEGVDSESLSRRSGDVSFNHVTPPLVVGRTYHGNKEGASLSKIIVAEVLIAGGTRKKVPKRAPVSPRPRIAINTLVLEA